jgi:hypothetical protein
MPRATSSSILRSRDDRFHPKVNGIIDEKLVKIHILEIFRRGFYARRKSFTSSENVT